MTVVISDVKANMGLEYNLRFPFVTTRLFILSGFLEYYKKKNEDNVGTLSPTLTTVFSLPKTLRVRKVKKDEQSFRFSHYIYIVLHFILVKLIQKENKLMIRSFLFYVCVHT